ncbi:Xylulose kinase (Xylulokinase) [Durusdinium trenchii]|uniref:Xylulose kinase (Xylulokinase) n=1 Tax=Durusdinium trenchii TaxID=1381693 RepID=A0ABP0HL17_9DINO
MSASSTSSRKTSPVLMWVEALDMILTQMKADQFPFHEVLAISGSGQQHGSVYWAANAGRLLGELDPAKALAPQLATAFARSESPIWADSSTGAQCLRVEKAVGRERLAKATGARAYERFTGMQIAKIIEEEPSVYEACERISLVSSAMCSILLGAYAPVDTSDGKAG